jgi:hypothetical protein
MMIYLIVNIVMLLWRGKLKEYGMSILILWMVAFILSFSFFSLYIVDIIMGEKNNYQKKKNQLWHENIFE